MYDYEMDPTRTVGATERTQDAGRMGGRTDRWTDRQSQTNIPPNNFVVWRVWKESKMIALIVTYVCAGIGETAYIYYIYINCAWGCYIQTIGQDITCLKKFTTNQK